MAADTLRERIAQLREPLRNLVNQLRWNVGTDQIADSILVVLEPWVEQAIREEREQREREYAEDYEQAMNEKSARLAEKDAQIREWETGAVAASTEIVKLRQQLQETRESFDAVVRAAGPFMPALPIAEADILDRLRETPAPPQEPT